jgi:hypothetical protein
MIMHRVQMSIGKNALARLKTSVVQLGKELEDVSRCNSECCVGDACTFGV